MIPILNFIQFIVQALLTVLFWILVINAVISWLVAFNVINLRNRTVYNIVRTLDRITEPLLRPLRRFIPSLGGIDFTPLILLLLIQGVQGYLIPPFFDWLRSFFVAPIL
jgi:YggT family protein